MRIIIVLLILAIYLTVSFPCLAEVTPEQYQIILDALIKSRDLGIAHNYLDALLQRVKSHIDPSNPLTTNVSWNDIKTIYQPIYLQLKQDVQDALDNMP